MKRATTAAGQVRALVDFAVARGASEAALLKASGIDAEALRDQDNRVPVAAYRALFRAAASATGDPAIALAFGAETDFRQVSIVGLIAYAARDMAEALAQMNRYSRLVTEVEVAGDGLRFENVMRADGRWLVDHRLNPNDFPELTESSWSRFIVGSRLSFPDHVFAYEAHVTHAAPAHRDAYERIWRVPVTFGAKQNAIRMNPDWPKVQIASENRYAFGVFSERADALLKSLQGADSMRGRVEQRLMPILHTGDISADRLACALGMSRPTLYRRLKEEGTTFEIVLDDLRRRLALHYLSGRKVSVNETAYLVGFSDPAAFSRAFKRWTGATPREARAGALDPCAVALSSAARGRGGRAAAGRGA
jgi:AraC-like DNA-binding protein